MSIENRGIDDELFNFLCKNWELAPIHQTMDISLTYLGKGEVGLKMNAGREYTTVRGRLHGGICAAFADTAMGWAIISLGRTCVTVDMYINYFAPVLEETELRAEGNIIHAGRRTVVAEATITTDRGELVAKSRGTFSLKKGNMEEFDQTIII